MNTTKNDLKLYRRLISLQTEYLIMYKSKEDGLLKPVELLKDHRTSINSRSFLFRVSIDGFKNTINLSDCVISDFVKIPVSKIDE